MKSEQMNPYLSEQPIPVGIKNETYIKQGKQIPSADEVVADGAAINSSYLVDRAPRVLVFTDAKIRKLYYNLSLPANHLLHYIEGIISI